MKHLPDAGVLPSFERTTRTMSQQREQRIRELWRARPQDKRCVIDVMLFEEYLHACEPKLLEGVEEKYKFLMKILWDEIIDTS